MPSSTSVTTACVAPGADTVAVTALPASAPSAAGARTDFTETGISFSERRTTIVAPPWARVVKPFSPGLTALTTEKRTSTFGAHAASQGASSTSLVALVSVRDFA